MSQILPELITGRGIVVSPVTNQIPISTDTNGDIYNVTGYKEGYRLNSSGAEVENTDFAVSGYIPFSLGDTIRFRKYNGYESNNGGIVFFNTNKVIIGKAAYSASSYYTPGAFVANGISKWTPSATEYNTNSDKNMDLTNAAYIRVVACLVENSPANWVLTINEVI